MVYVSVSGAVPVAWSYSCGTSNTHTTWHAPIGLYLT